MVFIVEDGTGLLTANAGISVQFADDYHSDRGNDLWVGTTTLKEQCIVRATGFSEVRFRDRYKGYKLNPRQKLSFPRYAVLDAQGFQLDEIPFQWQYGIAEYALRALIYGELAPDTPPSVPRQDNSGVTTTSSTVITGEIRRQTNKLGPIEQTIEYTSPSSSRNSNVVSREAQTTLVNTSSIPEYAAADLWFKELVISVNFQSSRPILG